MLQIQIEKNAASISIVKNGMKHHKTVDLGDLVSVMQAHAVHDFGMLPANTRYLAQSGNNYTIAIELPGGPRNLNVATRDGKGSEVVEKVNLPAALFFFQLVQRDGGFFHNTSYVFALPNDRLYLPTDKLYKFPTPNIYPEDNRVCWGLNDLKDKLKALSSVEGLVATFFKANFNHDLFDSQKLSQKFPFDKIQHNGNNYDIKSYFKFLAENQFNTEWLRTPQGGFSDFNEATKKLGK